MKIIITVFIIIYLSLIFVSCFESQGQNSNEKNSQTHILFSSGAYKIWYESLLIDSMKYTIFLTSGFDGSSPIIINVTNDNLQRELLKRQISEWDE